MCRSPVQPVLVEASMSIRHARAAAAAFALSLTAFASLGSAPAQAEIPAATKAEIDHLLAFVGDSGCEFYRNGSWYESKKGAEHLQMKLDWLAGRNVIQAAQDFIDKAATQSSMSTLAYKVRCKGGEPIESAKWLNDELARFRAGTKVMTAAAPATAPGVAVVAKPVSKVN